jgi:ATP-dependent 26S proteasome regulatory subunit
MSDAVDVHSISSWDKLLSDARKVILNDEQKKYEVVKQVHSNCTKLVKHVQLLKDEPYLDDSVLQFFKWLAWRNVEAYPATELREKFPEGYAVMDFVERVHEEVDGTCIRPTTLTTTFDDIIGLQSVKQSVQVRYTLAYEFPFVANLESSGLLLYGPPGTGKTLLAQALANQPHNKLLVVTHGSLKDKYEGGTEKAIEKVFQCAKTLLRTDPQTHSVFIFIDEFENIAGKKAEDASMTRTVNTLLQMMDGTASNPNVRVVAATNYISALEDAVVSRFSLKQFVDLPTATELPEVVLHMLAKKHTRAWGVGLDWYAETCPLVLLKILDAKDVPPSVLQRSNAAACTEKWSAARDELHAQCTAHAKNSNKKDAEQLLTQVVKDYRAVCARKQCKLISNRGAKMILEQALEYQLVDWCRNLNAEQQCAAPAHSWPKQFVLPTGSPRPGVYVYVPPPNNTYLDLVQPAPGTPPTNVVALHLEVQYLEKAYTNFKSEITLETYAQAILENLGVVF